MSRAKKLQRLLDNVANTLNLEVEIIDYEGNIIASSDKMHLGLKEPLVIDADKTDTYFLKNGKTFIKFQVDRNTALFLSMSGTSSEVMNYCQLTVSLLQAALNLTAQKSDRNEILRKMLLGQLSDLELQEFARDFKIEPHRSRCVFVVRTPGLEAGEVYRLLLNAFPKNRKDILVTVNGRTVALIKDLSEEMNENELVQLAAAIHETVQDEMTFKALIGIGKVKSNITEVSESYLEAVHAITVGRIYNVNEHIFVYERLLLERLLYEVPLEICRKYYQDDFYDGYKQVINEEMTATIEKFFENSLNLSETARQLYIHRNTLVYRLDKIYKIMGLDLRDFDDAVSFKIMMMLERRMQECLD